MLDSELVCGNKENHGRLGVSGEKNGLVLGIKNSGRNGMKAFGHKGFRSQEVQSADFDDSGWRCEGGGVQKSILRVEHKSSNMIFIGI